MDDTRDIALVPLTHVALELNITADELAARLAGGPLMASELIVGDSLGRRCIPAGLARELIKEAERVRYAAAETKRKQAAASTQRVAELQRKHPVARGVRNPLPDGTLPVAAMTAAGGEPRFDDATYRPVPGVADWMFNAVGGTGATIGPSRAAMKQAAKDRAAERAAAKQKGKK